VSTIPASSLCHIAGPRGPVLTCDTIVDDYLATVPLSTRRLHASGLGRALRVLHPGATHLTWRDVMVAATRLDAALHTRTDSPCLIAWARTAAHGLSAHAHARGLLTASEYANVRGTRRRGPRRERTSGASLGAVAALLLAVRRDTTLVGRRDAALLILLCHPTVAHSEIARLVPADVDLVGRRLHVRRLVGGPHPIQVPLLSPEACAALANWLAVRGDGPGRLFVPIDKAGRIAGDALAAQMLPQIVARRAARAGLGAICATDLQPAETRRTRRRAPTHNAGTPFRSSGDAAHQPRHCR